MLARYKKPLVSAVTVVAVVLLASLTARERDRLTSLEAWFLDALAPAQRWASEVVSRIQAGTRLVAEYRSLLAENARLRAEVERLTALEAEWEEVLAENHRLREFLGFAQRGEHQFVAAEVIYRNPDNWFNRLAVNKGTLHGVKKDMPVVAAGRLVGRVVRVSARTATVLLLTDPDSAVGALIQSSRDAGVVLGAPGRPDELQLRLFSRDARVTVGDRVVTSGLGGLFPPGLIIGEVTWVEREHLGLVRFAAVRPAVDLARLTEVLIIVSWQPLADFPDAEGR